MSQLHQMQITFEPEQDRLLFRLTTGGRQIQEFRLWLTRRYVRILWQALLNMLKSKQPEQFKQEPSKTAALAVEHQQSVAKADFQTPYQGGTVFPLGDEPILVSKVALKQAPNGQQILCLHPTRGQGLEFNLDQKALHPLCRLLADASNKADWGLNLDFAQASELIRQRGLN